MKRTHHKAQGTLNDEMRVLGGKFCSEIISNDVGIEVAAVVVVAFRAEIDRNVQERGLTRRNKSASSTTFRVNSAIGFKDIVFFLFF